MLPTQSLYHILIKLSKLSSIIRRFFLEARNGKGFFKIEPGAGIIGLHPECLSKMADGPFYFAFAQSQDAEVVRSRFKILDQAGGQGAG